MDEGVITRASLRGVDEGGASLSEVSASSAKVRAFTVMLSTVG